MANKTFTMKGLKELQAKFRKLENLIQRGSKSVFTKAGDKAIEIIRIRTAKGKDRKGSRFQSYSSAYAKKKGSSHVDLDLSGQMLKAINKKAFTKGVKIFIEATGHDGKLNSYNLAVVHITGANTGRAKMPKRDFFWIIWKRG